jgi:hypothetical protein
MGDESCTASAEIFGAIAAAGASAKRAAARNAQAGIDLVSSTLVLPTRKRKPPPIAAKMARLTTAIVESPVSVRIGNAKALCMAHPRTGPAPIARARGNRGRAIANPKLVHKTAATTAQRAAFAEDAIKLGPAIKMAETIPIGAKVVPALPRDSTEGQKSLFYGLN